MAKAGKPSGRLWIDPRINTSVAMLPGVQAELAALAGSLELQARAHLLQHRDRGDSRIERTRSGQKKDWWISLVDEHAMSIEYGHHTRSGTFVQGLGIIGGLL